MLPMSTGLLEKVEVEPETEISDGDNHDHVTCHCRLGWSWCGVELEIPLNAAPDLSGDDCPKCSALLLQFMDTCPFGCDCTSDMRLFNCAGDDEGEEE
jgi:hypothetical protein